MQASVVDVKALERRMVEYQKQEALQERLQAQLQELQDKVGLGTIQTRAPFMNQLFVRKG